MERVLEVYRVTAYEPALRLPQTDKSLMVHSRLSLGRPEKELAHNISSNERAHISKKGSLVSLWPGPITLLSWTEAICLGPWSCNLQ